MTNKQVTRYSPNRDGGMYESVFGVYVRAEDYERLQHDIEAGAAEIARLESIIRGKTFEPTVEAVSREETEAMRRAALEPTAGLCPHGLPLAENTCGPCSGGQPTVNRPDPGPGTLEEIYGAGRSSGGLGDYK